MYNFQILLTSFISMKAHVSSSIYVTRNAIPCVLHLGIQLQQHQHICKLSMHHDVHMIFTKAMLLANDITHLRVYTLLYKSKFIHLEHHYMSPGISDELSLISDCIVMSYATQLIRIMGT